MTRSEVFKGTDAAGRLTGGGGRGLGKLRGRRGEDQKVRGYREEKREESSISTCL